MKKIWPLLVMAMSLPNVAHSNPVELGDQAYERGHFEQAVQHWRTALNQFALGRQTTDYIDTAVRLSAAYQALGLPRMATDILQEAKNQAEKLGDLARQANVLSQLADCMIMGGGVEPANSFNKSNGGGICHVKDSNRWKKAQKYLKKAADKAREAKDTQLLASILNKQGNLWMAREDLKDALKDARTKYHPCIQPKQNTGDGRNLGKRVAFTDNEQTCIKKEAVKQERYSQCVNSGLNLPIKGSLFTNNALQCFARTKAIEQYKQSLSLVGDQTNLAAKVWLNLIQARINGGDYAQAKLEVEKALQRVNALPNSQEKAFALVGVAQLLRELQTPSKVQTKKKVENITPNRELMGIRRISLTEEIPFEKTPFASPSVILGGRGVSVQEKMKFRQQSYQALTQARQIGQTLQNARIIADANGYLAGLYANDKRYEEAIQLTQTAKEWTQNNFQFCFDNGVKQISRNKCKPENSFKSVSKKSLLYAPHQHSSSASLFRWERQLGQLFSRQGKIDVAIAAYQRAIEHLAEIRQAFLQKGYRVSQSFRDNEEGSVYFELADVLLQKAAHATDDKQDLLKAARDHIESYNVAELKNYFQDECITKFKTKGAHIEKALDPNTAILYPVVLSDRVELLVSTREGIEQRTTRFKPQENKRLEYEVELLRAKLEVASDIKSVLEHAQKLHEWFIKPINPILSTHHINTLVIVPQGLLRTIPFAVLHDSQHYLVEQYAVAVAPGLTLTDPTQPLQRDKIQALLAGLTKEVPDDLDFLPLPHVGLELEEIRTSIGGKVLKDEDFKIDRLKTELKQTPYTIMHVATHGHFDSDPNRTFLLAFSTEKNKGRLTMNRLRDLVALTESHDKQPLELLTLSACETAVGDEKAALGLAGVAVKAGARSGLATLWSVNDTATAKLVAAFYKQLTKNPTLSKAQALQETQKEFLQPQDSKYSHPYFWAAFLLIGNWL